MSDDAFNVIEYRVYDLAKTVDEVMSFLEKDKDTYRKEHVSDEAKTALAKLIYELKDNRWIEDNYLNFRGAFMNCYRVKRHFAQKTTAQGLDCYELEGMEKQQLIDYLKEKAILFSQCSLVNKNSWCIMDNPEIFFNDSLPTFNGNWITAANQYDSWIIKQPDFEQMKLLCYVHDDLYCNMINMTYDDIELEIMLKDAIQLDDIFNYLCLK